MKIMHVTPRKNWQHMRLRCREAGYEWNECWSNDFFRVRNTESYTHIFVHGYAINIDNILRLPIICPKTQVYAVNHGSQNHASNGTLDHDMKVLNSSHVLFCTNDKYRKADLYWGNPVYLPAYREKTIHQPTLVLCARDDWVKALRSQITAAALAQKKIDGLRVVLVIRGDQKGKAFLKRFIAINGLDVEIKDWLSWDEWNALLDETSVLLQPSFSETFNYVSLDAMAHGIPVIGTPVIKHIPNKFIINDANDSPRMAQMIESYINTRNEESSSIREVAEKTRDRQNADFMELLNLALETRLVE